MSKCECNGPGWCRRRDCNVTSTGHLICSSGDARSQEMYFRDTSKLVLAPARIPGYSCRHLGDQLRDEKGQPLAEECKTCRGSVKLKKFACHHEKHAQNPVTTYKECESCQDFVYSCFPTKIRGITTSVGYGHLLRVTLPANMRHLSECLVVTEADDRETIEVASSIPSVRVHITDAFRRHGARFNKGLAMEEGFDVLGRHGDMLIWDADTLFPDELKLDSWQPGCIHGATRRMADRLESLCPESEWSRFPKAVDGGPVGFFQLFQAEDPIIRDLRPWYDVSFAHAGGGDAYFLTRWPRHKQIILPFEVLHFGPRDTNWFGVDAEGRKLMDAFVLRNNWGRAMHGRNLNDAASKVHQIRDRVNVPGYAESSYELPFVNAAKGWRVSI